jgi:hypothetical protein
VHARCATSNEEGGNRASESFTVVVDDDTKQRAKIQQCLSMKNLEINETVHTEIAA